jgi:hypothetical protein
MVVTAEGRAGEAARVVETKLFHGMFHVEPWNNHY